MKLLLNSTFFLLVAGAVIGFILAFQSWGYWAVAALCIGFPIFFTIYLAVDSIKSETNK